VEEDNGMERRLAAILAADVVGYSRLMEQDESGTFTRLRTHRKELFEPEIAAHHGRVFKLMGDGLLAEFASVVDAVECAVALQAGMAERNAAAPAEHRIVARIGVNLGDVIVEKDDAGAVDMHGEGVIISNRLQALAEPGGICVSQTVVNHVGHKIAVGFEFSGEQRVKNIAEPVRVYRVITEPESVGRTVGIRRTSWQKWRWPAVAAALVVVIGSAVAWQRPWQPRIEAASIENMALPLPNKPSIAVLPFTNMSDDAKQEYFADGMTDDLITELSKVSGLFVISRNSVFVYKGKAVLLKQVSEELGVRYVLEGSVQRAGDRLRINAQLIDALSGGHVWADKFDGSIADVFALQDKVTLSIADALAVRLTNAEQTAVTQQETTVPGAYEAFLQGWVHYRRTTPDDYAKAIPYFEEAIKLDPGYGRAYAAVAMVYLRTYENQWADKAGPSLIETRVRAIQYLDEARKRPTTLSHQAAGVMLLWMENRPDRAIAEFKEAIALDSGDPLSYAYLGVALIVAVQPAEGMSHLRTAMRLDPHYPAEFVYFLGLAQFSLEHFEEAAASLESASKLNPDDERAFGVLAATYGHLGRKQEAKSAIARYNAIRVEHGDIPLTMLALQTMYLGEFRNYRDVERLNKGLDLAGVPASLFGREFAEKNRLTADQIRTLFLDHRLHGYAWSSGQECAASITKDGAISTSGGWGWSGEGIAQFEGEQLCLKYGAYVASCVTVFRNPGGTLAKENEYIWLEGDNAFTFSQVE
jgi:TolB-like protein/class 3 adenylate cyclase